MKMKKLISGFALVLAMAACKSVDVGSVEDTPIPSGVPVAPEVALQIGKNVANGGLAVVGGVVGTMAGQKLSAFFDGTIFNGTAVYQPTYPSSQDELELQGNVKEVVELLFQNQTSLADGWVLTNPSVEFCHKIAEHDDNLQACLQLISHLSFQVKFTDQHSGIVKAYVDQQQFAGITFSPTSMQVEAYLTAMPSALNLLKDVWASQNVTIDLPTLSDASGAIAAMISRSGNTVNLSVEAATPVSISGTHDEGATFISITQGTRASLEYDQNASLAKIELNVGDVNIVDNNFNLRAQGVSGKVFFDDQATEIRLQDVLIENPLVVNGVEDPFRIYLNPALTATLSFYNDGIRFAHSSYLGFYVSNEDGLTAWGAEAGAFEARGVNHPILRDGPAVGMHNTDGFMDGGGDGFLTVPNGSCFTGKPFHLVPCNP